MSLNLTPGQAGLLDKLVYNKKDLNILFLPYLYLSI